MGISQSLRKTNIPSVSHDWTTYEIFILFSGMTHTFYMTFSIRLSDVCCIRPQTLSKVFKSYWGDLELSRIVLSICSSIIQDVVWFKWNYNPGQFISAGMRTNLSKKKEDNCYIPSKQAGNELNCQIWETKKKEFLFKQENSHACKWNQCEEGKSSLIKFSTPSSPKTGWDKWNLKLPFDKLFWRHFGRKIFTRDDLGQFSFVCVAFNQSTLVEKNWVLLWVFFNAK